MVETPQDFQWIVFDIDGVLIDVSRSFDLAVRETVSEFFEKEGIDKTVSTSIIRRLRKKGSFNDDFQLCAALVHGGIHCNLGQIVANFPPGAGLEWITGKFGEVYSQREIEEVFQTYYLGSNKNSLVGDRQGLWVNEEPIVSTDMLQRAQQKYRLGVVTGRNELEYQLATKIIGFDFERVVTRDHAEKPDPKALDLVVKGAPGIYIGDTINDRKLVENYRAEGYQVEFLMIGKDMPDVNQALEWLLE